ncbi:MAG: hypothetical protein ACRDZ5_09280, partial [Acidimicrobiales bacterium]
DVGQRQALVRIYLSFRSENMAGQPGGRAGPGDATDAGPGDATDAGPGDATRAAAGGRHSGSQ